MKKQHGGSIVFLATKRNRQKVSEGQVNINTDENDVIENIIKHLAHFEKIVQATSINLNQRLNGTFIDLKIVPIIYEDLESHVKGGSRNRKMIGGIPKIIRMLLCCMNNPNIVKEFNFKEDGNDKRMHAIRLNEILEQITGVDLVARRVERAIERLILEFTSKYSDIGNFTKKLITAINEKAKAETYTDQQLEIYAVMNFMNSTAAHMNRYNMKHLNQTPQFRIQIQEQVYLYIKIILEETTKKYQVVLSNDGFRVLGIEQDVPFDDAAFPFQKHIFADKLKCTYIKPEENGARAMATNIAKAVEFLKAIQAIQPTKKNSVKNIIYSATEPIETKEKASANQILPNHIEQDPDVLSIKQTAFKPNDITDTFFIGNMIMQLGAFS